MNPVPFLDLKIQHDPIAEEINKAIARVLDSGWFLLGKEGEAFESEWASWLGIGHAIGVGSGTDAIQLALMGLGIGPGDEVITVANTCVPTITAIRACGATPVLVDVMPATLTMNPECLSAALTERTRAIIPVHLYGHPCDMDPILSFAKENDLLVVEDCAQAHGARYKGKWCGTLGDAAAFSFYPSKNLGAYGDAGAVVSNSTEVAARVRQLRVYGEVKRYHHEVEGTNSRLDEIQAAILRVKLKYLGNAIEERQKITSIYDESLSKPLINPMVTADWAESACHLYVVQCSDRDSVQRQLDEAGINTLIHYPIPVHLQAAYDFLPYGNGDFPVTEAAANRILSLPLYPGLQEETVHQICSVLNGIG